jgi:hypothetical protein
MSLQVSAFACWIHYRMDQNMPMYLKADNTITYLSTHLGLDGWADAVAAVGMIELVRVLDKSTRCLITLSNTRLSN